MEYTLLDFQMKPCETTYPELPSNIVRHSFDLLKDIPSRQDWVGYFDLVHQSHMAVSFTYEQWSTVLGDYFKLLKPGGYLQLLEIDFHQVSGRRWGMWAMNWLCKLGAMRKINIEIVANLPQLLKDTGFTLLCEDRKEPRFAETFPEEPILNAPAQWYIDSTWVMCIKAYELGFIKEEEWAEFQTGVRKEAQTLKDTTNIPAVMYLAQVSSFVYIVSRLHDSRLRQDFVLFGYSQKPLL